MRTFDRLADLPLQVDDHRLERRSRQVSATFERVTTTFHLHGGGEEGLGEDVTYDVDDQARQLDAGPVLPLTGTWTIASFSEHLAGLDLFHGAEPSSPAYLQYRTWAIESAALDLALRQAGRTLGDVLGREHAPVRFAVSLRVPDTEAAPVFERIEAYPGVRFKLDPEPIWDEALIARLADSGAVDVLDFKGLYKGTIVDVETDPVLYRRCAEAMPSAWLEDPDLTHAEAAAVLEPHRDRITWDANIHSVDDVLGLPFPPRTLNCKPSRFGSLATLFDFYDHCEAEGIGLYGGGQSELGVGRGQIQLLASLFHPDGTNDIAPSGWDHEDFKRTGLPVSPLPADPEPTGFRRRGVA